MSEWRNRITETRLVSASELAKNEANFRRHPATQAKAVRGLLNEVGIVAPLIAYQSERYGALTLIDGHMRQEIGGEWPVTILNVSDAEADLILASLDYTASLAELDGAALAELLGRVEMTPVEDEGVAALLASLAAEHVVEVARTDVDAEPQIDKADELRIKWGVESGQMWQLGEHRLICGDCTDASVVARVMGGEKAQAVVTDSPYGMSVDGVENDSEAGLDALFEGVLSVLPMTDGVCVNFQGARLFWKWMDATRRHGHSFERTLWLYKPNDGTYPWRGWLQTGQLVLISSLGKPEWGKGEYKHDTYQVNYVGDALEKMHATPKPLEVITHILSWVSPDVAIVYDPFLGSGTTILACEQLGRKARAVEISPAYVAVALQRYLDATGLTPTLLEAA